MMMSEDGLKTRLSNINRLLITRRQARQSAEEYKRDINTKPTSTDN